MPCSPISCCPNCSIEKNRRRFRLREANPVGALMVVTQYPAITALVLCLVFSNLAERMLESVWVLYTGYRYGWGPAAVGFSLAAFGALFAISQGVLVRLVVPWLGEWRTIIGGLAIAALSFFLYAFASAGWMVYAILVVHILGWSLAGPAIQAVATRAVPANEQGLAAGRFHEHRHGNGDHRRAAGGGLFGYFVGPNAPFLFPGAPFVLGGVLFLISLALTVRGRGEARPALASSEIG